MSNDRVTEIDLLRFFAAMAVVIFHYAFRGFAADNLTDMPYPLLENIAKYGYLGVDLFFLISGFVIFMTASSGGVRRFLVSRAARLYPAFWICCSATFLVTFFLGGSRFAPSLGQYLVNLTMMSDFVNVPPIDGVYWTLFIEIKLYAIVTVILLLRQVHRIEALLSAWLAVVAILDIFPVYTVQSILITHYAPYFIAGAIFFLIFSKGLSGIRIALAVTAWVVALKHGLSLLPGYEQRYGVDFDDHLVIGIISVWFVVMFLIATQRTGWFRKTNWTLLGSLTYPLYLLHENIGFTIINILYPALNEHVVLWGTIGLMLVFSYWVNIYIENRYAPALRTYLHNLLKLISIQLPIGKRLQ